MIKHNTNSLKETLKLGQKMVPSFNTNIIGLIGELGSGKTAFVKGVGQYFKIKNITSPTFVIMKVYKITLPTLPTGRQAGRQENNKKYNNLVHIDCYRLKNYESLIDIGIEDYLNDNQSLVLIEWADKIKDKLPKRTKYIKFKLGKNEDQRIINI